MGAPMLEEVLRVRFSHGAAPAYCGHGLRAPTTKKAIHCAAFASPDRMAGRQASCAWRDGVVGRFLHVSSVYFFDHLSHTTARNFVERTQ